MIRAIQIPLPSGHVALIDEADAALITAHKWTALAGRKARTVYVRTYIRASTPERRGRKALYLHRVLMNPPLGMFVDHINGDGLDNRRSNLRICSRSENTRNRRKFNAGTSGFKGVHFNRQTRTKPWAAQIQLGEKTVGGKPKATFLGYYSTETEAARAYDEAARHHFGPFARLNFPDHQSTTSLQAQSYAGSLSECDKTIGAADKRVSQP